MKGQEEIMGFMLVVVMVIVIGIGLLFFFSPKAPEQTDLGMQNLLYAWLSTSFEGSDIRGIISSCDNCDLKPSVDILDSAISKSGVINRINGYSLNITGRVNYYSYKGKLNGTARGAVVPVEDTEVRLRFYS